jgi:hypothetical protein
VVEQVLAGRYADSLGNIKEVPDRISFDPFPWHSMAVWILTQMKRWKHIDGEVDYKKVAEQACLAAACDTLSPCPSRFASDRQDRFNVKTTCAHDMLTEEDSRCPHG